MNSRNNHNDLNNRRRNQNEESFFSRRSWTTKGVKGQISHLQCKIDRQEKVDKKMRCGKKGLSLQKSILFLSVIPLRLWWEDEAIVVSLQFTAQNNIKYRHTSTATPWTTDTSLDPSSCHHDIIMSVYHQMSSFPSLSLFLRLSSSFLSYSSLSVNSSSPRRSNWLLSDRASVVFIAVSSLFITTTTVMTSTIMKAIDVALSECQYCCIRSVLWTFVSFLSSLIYGMTSFSIKMFFSKINDCVSHACFPQE